MAEPEKPETRIYRCPMGHWKVKESYGWMASICQEPAVAAVTARAICGARLKRVWPTTEVETALRLGGQEAAEAVFCSGGRRDAVGRPRQKKRRSKKAERQVKKAAKRRRARWAREMEHRASKLLGRKATIVWVDPVEPG